MQKPEITSGVFSTTFALILEGQSPTGVRACHLASMMTSRYQIRLSPLHWLGDKSSELIGFYSGDGDLSSGPQACATDTTTKEPSLYLLVVLVFCSLHY